MIECKSLSKTYGVELALDSVSLKLEQGRIIGLLGSNGSGKTTLIKLINGLLQPTFGSVEIDGKAPCPETKSKIAYLPENNFLDLNLKVRDVIKYYKDFFADFDEDKAARVITELGINTNAKLKTLSKGMKEKVQLALVISRNAEYYIFDEPIGGVDPAARDHILNIILENFNQEATLIISTHLIADIERILDEVIFINFGKVVLHENADKLRNERSKSIDSIFREDFRC